MRKHTKSIILNYSIEPWGLLSKSRHRIYNFRALSLIMGCQKRIKCYVQYIDYNHCIQITSMSSFSIPILVYYKNKNYP